MLTEGPCLAPYAKDEENIVTTDASTTRLGITLWQAYGTRYLNDTEKNDSICELELLAVVWKIRKVSIQPLRKESSSLYRPPSTRTIIKRNRNNKQYSARLTRWLYRLIHFDIAIQHIAGSNLKFTDYFSRNPVGGPCRKKITMRNT